jgi:hypothetical protein
MKKWRIRRIQRELAPGYPIREFYWYASNGLRYWKAPSFEWVKEKVWEELNA